MKFKQKVLLQKTISLITGFVLVFQSLTPSLFISSKIFAQDASTSTPTETVTPTTAPTVEPTSEPTAAPTTEPTILPTETITPTPTVELTPTIIPNVTETPAPTETVTPTVEPTNTETRAAAPEQTNNNGPPANTDSDNNQSSSNTTSSTPTSTITPEPTIIVEQPETGAIQATIIKNVAAPTLNLDGVNPDGSAKLTTDKADYAPTDSAIISGKDFTVNKTYQLIISSPDDPATSTTVNVTSDENGTFIYAYQLDGNYRPNYKVEVKDGDKTVATTTFTDSVTIQSATVNGGSTATVSPGASVITIVNVKNTSNNNWRSTKYTVQGQSSVCVDHTNHNGNGDYSETFSITAPNVSNSYDLDLITYQGDNCTGTSKSFNTMPDAIIVTQAITTNPTLAQSCGLDVALVMDNSQSITHDQRTQMKNALTGFTSALSGTPTQFSVTRFGTSASLIQGFTSTISSVNAAINSMPADPTGEYTNWEAGLQTAGGSFSAGTANPNLIIFATDGDPTTSSAGPSDLGQPNIHLSPAIVQANSIKTGGTRILALGIGSPTLSRLEAISGPTVGTNLGADVIVTDFGSLATALATFASQTCGRTVTVTKLIDADGNLNTTGDRTVAPGWTFNVGGQSGKITDANGQTPAVSLAVGTGYTVTETPQTNYGLLSASCTGATNNGSQDLQNNRVTGIQIANGNIVSCTFINARNTGTVIVHKDVQGPTGQNVTDTSTNFTVQLDNANSQTITDNGTVTYSNVTSGSHTIKELTAPSGYTIYGISTTQGASGNTSGLTVTIGSGTTHVYVTNRQQQGTITVYKDVRISSSVDASDNHTFTTQLDGANNSSFSENSPKSFTITPGTHSISELTETGYTNMGCKLATGGAATNFTVANGATVSVTCTNYQIKPTLTLAKTVIKNNGGTANATAWTLQAVGPVTISGVTETAAVTSAVVSAGIYTLSESNGPAGYTASLYSCVKNGGSSVVSNSITLALGDMAVCTITNDDQAAILHVVKNLLGSTNPKSDFSFSVNGKPTQAFETDGQNDLTVDAGTYSVVESTATGYATTYDYCTNVVIGNGGEATCTITNTKYGSISGYKYEDQNGTIETENTDTNPVSEWSISLWKLVGDTWIHQSDTTTDVSGYYLFTGLLPGDYQVREGAQTSWTNLLPTTINVSLTAGMNSVNKNFLNTYVDETDKRVTLCHATASETNPFNQITVSTSGAYHGHIAHEDIKDIIPPFVYNDTSYSQNWDTIGQAIWNNGCDPNIYGTIHVTKYNDANNSGYRDERETTLSDWQIHLGETTKTTSETGVAQFTDLIYGTYTLSETVGDGWAQTNIQCDGEEGKDTTNEHTVTVHPGQTTDCVIGNYYAPPKLQLSKVNNASGNLTTGSTVTYTMTLKAQDNKSYNVKVTDLVPQGFAFTGAWSATKNGSPMTISVPTYHSPGTWSLGDLQKDDEVVLTMTVQVSDSQKPGIYKDLALAYGCETDNTCSDVVATADTGKVSDTFVGTAVNIVKEQQDSKTLTVNHTETTEGSVLGATTDLPSTGADSNWIVVAITLMVTGLGAVIVANKMRRYHA